jgi:uncharacterized protein DUF1579
MNIRRLAITAFVVATLALSVVGQTKDKKTGRAAKPATAQPSGEQMEREMQNATPGDHHSRLAKLAGEYTTVGKFSAASGAPPMEMGGEAKLSMSLDGRFLIEEDTGTLVGQPLKGFRILGYNNASKRYEGIWTYTMSTAIMTLNGTSADAGNTINFNASFDDQGGSKKKLQIVMRRMDDDHFVVELTDGSAGPKPMLVTTYSRKK